MRGTPENPFTPPLGGTRRMIDCTWRQRAHLPTLPSATRLDGRRALVTGGGRGIGLATTRGLIERGAIVTSASRSSHSTELDAAHLPIDLADLASVREALAHLRTEGAVFDLVVANAGLWPQRYSRSEQDFEIAFATNVLGHHALLRGLQRSNLLASDACVVLVTGDIYILEDSCTEDFVWHGRLGGQRAYCRSKLGNLWQAHGFAERFPKLRVHAVHPGVIASELSGQWPAPVRRLMEAMMLRIDEGARTTLDAILRRNRPSGRYVHARYGDVALDPRDPGADGRAATALWDRLEALTADIV